MLMMKIQCQENYRDFINKINIKVYFQVMFMFDDIYNNNLHVVIHFIVKLFRLCETTMLKRTLILINWQYLILWKLS